MQEYCDTYFANLSPSSGQSFELYHYTFNLDAERATAEEEAAAAEQAAAQAKSGVEQEQPATETDSPSAADAKPVEGVDDLD